MLQDQIQSFRSSLRNYNSQLANKNLLVDIPWTMVDGDLNLQRLIFNRNNSLYIITEGVIQESSWEYLPSMNSLAISIDGKRILMNEVFADGTVLILKKDGNSQDLIAFVNESELPKVDLVEYLNQELKTKNRLIINDPVEPPISDVLAKILIFLVIVFVIGSLLIEIFK
jgi:hypothetical protein